MDGVHELLKIPLPEGKDRGICHKKLRQREKDGYTLEEMQYSLRRWKKEGKLNRDGQICFDSQQGIFAFGFFTSRIVPHYAGQKRAEEEKVKAEAEAKRQVHQMWEDRLGEVAINNLNKSPEGDTVPPQPKLSLVEMIKEKRAEARLAKDNGISPNTVPITLNGDVHSQHGVAA